MKHVYVPRTTTRASTAFTPRPAAFFAFLFLLFIRFLPAISIAEMKELVRESAGRSEGGPR